jgi:hypothetical protein
VVDNFFNSIADLVETCQLQPDPNCLVLPNVETIDRCRNKVSKDQIANAVNVIQRAKTFRWNNRTRSSTTSTASARLSGLPTVNIPVLWVVVQSSTRGSLTRGNNFLFVKP